MTQPTSNSPGLQSLSELSPLAADEAQSWLHSLLAQLAQLHNAGHLHGSIAAGGVVIDEHRQPILSPAADRVVLDADTCPPELPADKSWNLPTDLAKAKTALAAAGFEMDPRRIDVYQLGVLLCRLLTARSTGDYLRSPNARGLVPTSLRPLIDRALGHDAGARIADCEQFSAQLTAAANGESPTWARETPPLGLARTPVTLPGPSAERGEDDFAPAAASDAPLTRLGAYKVLSRIGGGGMGDVYKAHDESLDRIVAVKVLPPELARHADFVRRFRAEAMAIAMLTHPNIVQVYAFGEDGGRHFFAMQFVDGESLADLLHRRSRLPLDEALPIFEQCLAGLAAAHERNLIHRDIKPGNILLDRQHHRALVADFGLVKNFESGSRLTASGVIMGTVDYISPEQARGQPVDGRSDLYSLGALMYQSLSGSLPFVSESATGLMFQHAYEQPKPLNELVPSLPKQIEAIVVRLMAKDPAQRYARAEDVLADIAAFRAGKPPVSTSHGESKSKIVAVPRDDVRDPAVTGEFIELTGTPAVGSWRDRLWNALHVYAPRAVQRLANTQHQVDGAVIEYERRRNQLASLLREAAAVAAEFKAQAASHREAAAAAERRAKSAAEQDAIAAAQADQAHCERIAVDFESQLAEQQDQLDSLQLRSKQVDATLLQLRSQRDVLQARLRSAQARLAMEGAGSGRRSPWIWKVPVATVAVLAIVVVALYLLRPTERPSTVVGNPLFRDAVLAATFDEASPGPKTGELYIRDLSETRPPGSLHGATLVPGKAGLGLALQNDGDYVDFGKAAGSPRPTLGVCAWIKPTAPAGEFADIVSEDSAVGGAHGFALRLYTGRPYLAVGDGAWHWFGTEQRAPIDRWTHVAVVRGPNQSKFYVNGEVVATSEEAKLIQPAATSLRIGNSAETDGRQFYGVIDEVALFERVLSDDEIQRIYRLGAAGLSLNAPPTSDPPAAPADPLWPPIDPPATSPVTAEKIVLWNMHDGKWADRGTNVVHVELRRDGKTVWSQKDVKVAWNNTVDPSTEIPIPNIPFDTVRLDIVNWVQWGAGLSEVEVISDGRNIALNKPVKANGERLPFIGARLVDGVKTPGPASIGMWWAPDNQPAWVELTLASSSPTRSENSAESLETRRRAKVSHGASGLVCARLTANEEPTGLAAGAEIFNGPDGDGRQRSKGVLLGAPAGWESRGTVWSFTLQRTESAFGVQIIHPLGKGQVLVSLWHDVAIATNGFWDEFGWSDPISNLPIERSADLAKLLPLQNGPVEVVSRLDANGNYQMELSGKVVARAKIDTALPMYLGIRPGKAARGVSNHGQPEFGGAGLPRALEPGEAALLLSPFDGGVYYASTVRLELIAKTPEPAAHAAAPPIEFAYPVRPLSSAPVVTAWNLSEMPVLNTLKDDSADAPVSLGGERSTHGFMLRPVGAMGRMVFDISGRQATRFRGRVGLNDSMAAKTSLSPQTFRVVLDDKPTWKSRPLSERGAFQDFDIPLAGVKKIELVNDSPEVDRQAQPVWFEPRLSTDVFEAITRLSTAKVDESAHDVATFTAATDGLTAPGQYREVAISLRALCDQALAADQFAQAEQLIRMARLAADKSNEPTLVKETAARLQEVELTRGQFDKVQKSRDLLAANPQDPAANLELGRFECFYHGNWEAGLPRIAQGEAGNLRSLAERELQKDLLPSKLPGIADEWWQLAEAEAGLSRRHMLFHAAELYRRAAMRLGDGPAKAEAEERIRDVGQLADAPFEFRTYFWCRIVNRATENYLSVSQGNRNPGEIVILWGGWGGLDQQWQFVFNEAGDVRIVNRNSGLPIGIREGSNAPGKDTVQWPSNVFSWRLERVTGNYVRIVAVQSGQCLDVNIDRAVQSVRGSTDTQIWSLEPIP